jgi:hypothetical protein
MTDSEREIMYSTKAPRLEMKDYAEALSNTTQSSKYVVYGKIETIPLSSLITVKEYEQDGGQIGRANDANPKKYKAIAASYQNHGISPKRGLIQATPHPNRPGMNIAADGLHRTMAHRVTADERGIPYDQYPVTVQWTYPTDGTSFELFLGSVTGNANGGHFPQVDPTFQDFFVLGRNALQNGLFDDFADDDDEVRRDAVKNYLVEEANALSHMGATTLGNVVSDILNMNVRTDKLIMWDEEIAKTFVAESNRLGSAGNIKDGVKCYTSPIFQTKRTAINNWQTFSSLTKDQKARFFLWDADDDLGKVVQHRQSYFTEFYKSYKQVYSWMKRWHDVSEPCLTPEKLFSKAEFWVATQIVSDDPRGSTRKKVEKIVITGEDYHAFELSAAEAAKLVKD